MNCGAVKARHLSTGYCAKQVGRLELMNSWTKYDPALIPKPPAGWSRSTFPGVVNFSSRDERISLSFPIKAFLKSRDPLGVLRLAIAKERAILRGVQKTGHPPVSGSRRVSR
jgi:hypothetical protein